MNESQAVTVVNPNDILASFRAQSANQVTSLMTEVAMRDAQIVELKRQIAALQSTVRDLNEKLNNDKSDVTEAAPERKK